MGVTRRTMRNGSWLPFDGLIRKTMREWPLLGGGSPIPAQDRVMAWWEFEESTQPGFVPLFSAKPIESWIQTSNGYTSVPGVRGQAALMDAATLQYANMNNQTINLSLQDQIWGVTGWYRTHTTLVGEGGRYITDSWFNITAIPGRRKWRVIINPAENGFVFSMGQGPLATDITDIDTGDIGLTPDTFYHFAATHDPDNDEMTFTISERGGSVGSRLTAAIVGGAYVGLDPNQNIYVGRPVDTSTTTVYGNGRLDMLAFWDDTAVLTEAEVEALFVGELKYSDLADPAVPVDVVIDTFTDTNGTPIASHTPDLDTVGGGWILDRNGLTIESNALLPSNLGALDMCTIDAGISDAIYTVSARTAYVDDSNHGVNRVNVHLTTTGPITDGYTVYVSPGFTTNHFRLRDNNAAIDLGNATVPELQNQDDIAYTVEILVRGSIIRATLTVGAVTYVLGSVTATNNTTETRYGLLQTGLGTYTMRPFDNLLITTVPL